MIINPSQAFASAISNYKMTTVAELERLLTDRERVDFLQRMFQRKIRFDEEAVRLLLLSLGKNHCQLSSSLADSEDWSLADSLDCFEKQAEYSFDFDRYAY